MLTLYAMLVANIALGIVPVAAIWIDHNRKMARAERIRAARWAKFWVDVTLNRHEFQQALLADVAEKDGTA